MKEHKHLLLSSISLIGILLTIGADMAGISRTNSLIFVIISKIIRILAMIHLWRI